MGVRSKDRTPIVISPPDSSVWCIFSGGTALRLGSFVFDGAAPFGFGQCRGRNGTCWDLGGQSTLCVLAIPT